MASFLNDLLRVGSSKVLIIVFGISTSIITARYLGPEGNGLIAGLMVYPSLFMSIGSLGIRQSTTYFLGKGIYSEEKIKTAITQIWMLSTLISLIVSFFLMYFLSNSGENIYFVLLALAPIPFTLFNTYNSGIFLGKNDIKTFNKINWIPTLLSLIGSVVFIILLSLGVQGALLAMIAGPFCIFLIYLFKNKFLNSFSLRVDFTVVGKMLSLGLIYALALFIINLNYNIDIILLDKLSSPFQTGIYSKGSGITQYLWQIPMLLSTIVFARSAVSKNDLQFSVKVAQLLRISFLFIGVASLILVLFSEMVIVGMYGEGFRGSISVLNLLLPGVLILTIYKVMNMDLAGRGKPWISMYSMVPACVINIILNFILIPKNGANGAAIASLISYSSAGLLFLHFYSKEVNIPIKQILTYSRKDFEPVKFLFKKVLKIK